MRSLLLAHLARAHVCHPCDGREPLRGNKIKVTHTHTSVHELAVLCCVDSKSLLRRFKIVFKVSNSLVVALFFLSPVPAAMLWRSSHLPSQRPTHRGSIFRLLLKIAVGLPRSCDSSQFLQGLGPNQLKTESDSNTVLVEIIEMRRRAHFAKRVGDRTLPALFYGRPGCSQVDGVYIPHASLR